MHMRVQLIAGLPFSFFRGLWRQVLLLLNVLQLQQKNKGVKGIVEAKNVSRFA